MPSLFDYRNPPTRAQILAKFGQLLQLAGFPVFSWSPFDVLRRLVEDESDLFEDLGGTISKVALSYLLRFADDEWAEYIGESWYDEPRKQAVRTQGVVRLSDSLHVGPTVIEPRGVWVGNEIGSRRFVVVGPYVEGAELIIPLDGFLDVVVEAEFGGADYNLAVGDVNTLQTDLLGVTAVNVAVDAGTWITQQGTDLEDLALYIQRLRAKWSTLGSGADDDGYWFRALSSSDEVTRAKVRSPAGGQVRIVVGGPSGPVSAAALASATAANTDKVQGVPDVATQNCAQNTQVVRGVLELLPGTSPAAALAAAKAAVQTYARGLDIGPRKVSKERIGKALLVDGVDDVNLTDPAADFVPAPNEMWVPTFDLTAVVIE